MCTTNPSKEKKLNTTLYRKVITVASENKCRIRYVKDNTQEHTIPGGKQAT